MAEVELNDAFFEELGRSPAVVNLCREKAEEVAAIARSTAPVGPDSRGGAPGDYRDSIRVEIQHRNRRNAAVVVADNWKSLLIESQTGNLARALNQVKKSG